MDAMPPAQLQTACIEQAAAAYGVDPQQVQRELKLRGGQSAQVFRNADGTFEVGLMRIPSAALPALGQYGITGERLLRDDCLNIKVATYMMALRPARRPAAAALPTPSLRPLPVAAGTAPNTPGTSTREACMVRSAQAFRLPVELLRAIAKTEGGETGVVSRNRNGSVDMGVMQVNSIHLSSAPHNFLARGITAEQLVNDDCVNIAAGASILRYEIDRASNFWSGVARYHSRTPYYGSIYLGKVVRNLRAMGVTGGGNLTGRSSP